jgi:hypothetical protein
MTIGAGTTTVQPIKLTQSGAALLTTPVAGTIECNDGDKLYYTIKTGTARKTVAFVDLAQTWTGVQTFNGRMAASGNLDIGGNDVYLIGDETGLMVKNTAADAYRPLFCADLSATSIATDSNEAIAFDVISHTITAAEEISESFTETWSKATAANVVNIECQYYGDSTHFFGAVPNEPLFVGTFIGTTISVDDLAVTLAEGDTVQIFITYKK